MKLLERNDLTLRILFLTGAWSCFSLILIGIGSFVADQRLVLLERENFAKSLAQDVASQQIILGLKPAIDQCIEGLMSQFRPSGSFLSRRDARTRAQETCSNPSAMSAEFVTATTPEDFQALWFRYSEAVANSQASVFIRNLSPYAEHLRKFGVLGVLVSVTLILIMVLVGWIRNGSVFTSER